jgi:hypothetical protein
MVNYSWYHSSLECKYFISIRPKFDYRLSIFCKFHLFFYFSFISTTSFFLLLLCFFLFFGGGVWFVWLSVSWELVLNHGPYAWSTYSMSELQTQAQQYHWLCCTIISVGQILLSRTYFCKYQRFNH